MNRKIKCLITDFDETFFKTAISAEARNTRPVDWDKVYSLIPQFEIYPGWAELLTWLKENGVRFAVVSLATRGILTRTFKHFGIEPEYVGCFDMFHRKPHARNIQKALEKLGLQPDEVLSVGNSLNDLKQAELAGVPFVGACWDSRHKEELKAQANTVDHPMEIIKYIQ